MYEKETFVKSLAGKRTFRFLFGNLNSDIDRSREGPAVAIRTNTIHSSCTHRCHLQSHQITAVETGPRRRLQSGSPGLAVTVAKT